MLSVGGGASDRTKEGQRGASGWMSRLCWPRESMKKYRREKASE